MMSHTINTLPAREITQTELNIKSCTTFGVKQDRLYEQRKTSMEDECEIHFN